MTSPASKIHQEVMLFLGNIINIYAKYKNLGMVLFPLFQMKLAFSGREPDLLFIKKENLHRVKPVYFDGPASLSRKSFLPKVPGETAGTNFTNTNRRASRNTD